MDPKSDIFGASKMFSVVTHFETGCVIRIHTCPLEMQLPAISPSFANFFLVQLESLNVNESLTHLSLSALMQVVFKKNMITP